MEAWIPIVILVVLIAILGIYIWSTYNSLITLKQRVDEAWSDITVQLKRRTDLIPNIINSVQGYAAHEKGVFESVTQARAESLQAKTPAQATQAENHFQQAIGGLFAVAENYPELKANQNFLQLQSELVDTEDKIQSSRRFYNGGIREFNTKIQVFPNNIFARRLGFTTREFFEVADIASISEPPQVKF